MLVKASAAISAPASAAWQILGEDFATVSNWLEAVFTSSLDGEVALGAIRTCTLAKNLVVKEKLIKFDRQSHALTYSITSGLPAFMGTVTNAWTIDTVGSNQSRATSVVTANLAWFAVPLTPLIKISLGKTLRGAVDQLAKAAEASARSIVDRRASNQA